jgi:hypothetical protein
VVIFWGTAMGGVAIVIGQAVDYGTEHHGADFYLGVKPFDARPASGGSGGGRAGTRSGELIHTNPLTFPPFPATV